MAINSHVYTRTYVPELCEPFIFIKGMYYNYDISSSSTHPCMEALRVITHQIHQYMHMYMLHKELAIMCNVINFDNLQVKMVTLLGGPAPAPVCALNCNIYIVSGDNPPVIEIIILLLNKLLLLVPLNCSE